MTEDERSIGDMPDVNADETLRDVVAALSALPDVSESEVRRIVAIASANDQHDGDPVPLRPRTPRWYTSIPLAAAAALVLAAGIGGFAFRDITTRDRVPAGVVGSPPPANAVAVGAATPDAAAEAPVSTQFVLAAPTAARVALVGAFNSWDAQATPLVRDPATGLWTVTLPLAPGRHVYAFMVDDTLLTLDPRAPATRDADLGTTASVILVGTP